MSKPTTRKELEQAVIKKAVVDDAFRNQLLADPRSAIEAVLAEGSPGAKLPAKLEVKVFEEPRDGLFLVLPPARAELSEAELEAAAGGSFICVFDTVDPL